MSAALLASLLLAPALRVDCSHGGDLVHVLRSQPQPVVLEIAGTCTGPIEIVRDAVTLHGEEPSGAAILGGVAVRGAREVRLENLRLLEGQVALRALDAEVTLEDCELGRADVAVEAEDATLTLVRTTLHHGRNGIRARRSRVSLEASTVRDVSDEGILARELSDLRLFQTQVSSDGIAVESHSGLSAVHSVLEGALHVGVFSRVSLAGSSLGGDLFASNSEVYLFRLPVGGTVRVRDGGLLTAVEADLQDVRLDGGSHARLTTTRVAGGVLAEDFSTVQLASTSVTGVLACRTGADAVCTQAHAGSVSDCPGCAP
jgi:hypothetical protein